MHNKMIFDSLNEVLDNYRPYGYNGEPYPWKSTIKAQRPKVINDSNMEDVLDKAKTKVVEWAQNQCGYYGEEDEFLADKTNSFCEEYLAQYKEDKLSRMLAVEVIIKSKRIG